MRMDVSGEFWVTPNGLDLLRRAGSYVRFCYWKEANMIRPRNGIQSDFGFIYSIVSYKSIAMASRVRSNNRFTFAALFLSEVVTTRFAKKLNPFNIRRTNFALSSCASALLDSQILQALIFSIKICNPISEISRIQLCQIMIYFKGLFFVK